MILSHRKLDRLRLPAGAANWQVIAWIAFFFVSYLALPMILPHWLNLRYMSMLFGPFYLMAGVGFWYCASVCRSRLGAMDRKIFAGFAIAVVAIGAITDYQRFQRVVVREALTDLSVKMVLDANNPIEPLVGNRGSSAGEVAAAEAQVSRAPTPENYLNLSLQYHRQKRYQDSITACKEALKLKPDYAEAYNNMGAAYNGLEMWDDAIRAAQEAIRINPDFQLAKNNLAWSVSQKKLQAEKLAAEDAEAKRAPTPERYLNLSLAYYRNGRYQDSIAASREALKLRPDYAAAYNNIAAANQSMGYWDEAIQAAQQALKLHPDFQLAQNNMQYSLNQKRLKVSANARKQ